MSFKKSLTIIVWGLTISIFSFPVQALESSLSLHQYKILNRVAFYRVAVLPEHIGLTTKGLKINFYVLGGRISGSIINGDFATDRTIIVNGEETINGDEATITPQGIGRMELNAKIVADDGTILYLRYTGFFILAEDWKKYPFVSLLTVMTFSTDNPNYQNVTNTKYIGEGELDLLNMIITYNIYPVR